MLNTKGVPSLERPIESLHLSVRSVNSLRRNQINIIGELVQRTPQNLLAFKNFGETCLAEVQCKLAELGLALGMTVPPPLSLAHMTLRDWFAGQTLVGLLADHRHVRLPLPSGVPHPAAEQAYLYADAMLEARKQEESHDPDVG